MNSLNNSKNNSIIIGGALMCLAYLILFSIPVASAITWNIDHTTVISNSTEYWITNLGSLGDVNASQFESNGIGINKTLSINNSWLEFYGNDIWCELVGCTMNGDIDMNYNDISNVGNIAGDRVNITGDLVVQNRLYLGVDPSEAQSVINPGDFGMAGNLALRDGFIFILPEKYGVAMAISNYGADNKTDFYLGANANLNTTTRLFCDYTYSPFFENSTGLYIVTLSSSQFLDRQIPLLINNYQNSSCVFVDTGVFGMDDVGDITSISYATAPKPTKIILDNGVVEYNIGNGDNAYFTINNINGTSSHNFRVLDKVGVNSRQSSTFETDSYGFDGTSVAKFLTYTSVNSTNERSTVITLQADEDNMNGGTIRGIDFELLSQSENITSTFARVDPNTDEIIRMGAVNILDSGWSVNSTSVVNRTYNFTNLGSDAPVFIEDNSYIMIGNSENFTSITFSLSTESSQEITPLFYYCNSTGQYETLPIISDTTSGFTESGTISFNNPTNRGKCNTMLNGSLLPDTNNYTYVIIQRTRNLIAPNTPVINIANIAGGGLPSFLLTDDILKINPVDTAPLVCPANLGAMYFDISEDGYCQCKSTGWKVMEDGTDCT